MKTILRILGVLMMITGTLFSYPVVVTQQTPAVQTAIAPYVAADLAFADPGNGNGQGNGNGGGNADHKVAVCHVPPGNPGNAHVVVVDKSAWDAGHTPHNNHDQDWLITDNWNGSPQPGESCAQEEEPTNTPEPTNPPPATPTAKPTNTPLPTNPPPSATPRPTNTPVPPTNTPQPDYKLNVSKSEDCDGWSVSATASPAGASISFNPGSSGNWNNGKSVEVTVTATWPGHSETKSVTVNMPPCATATPTNPGPTPTNPTPTDVPTETPVPDYSLSVSKSETCDAWYVSATASPAGASISFNPGSSGNWNNGKSVEVTVTATWPGHTETAKVTVNMPNCDTPTPEPSVTPTNPPPTATKVVEKNPVVVEAECDEPKVELESRKDPESGFERIWRIWTNKGVQTAERDLFLGLNGEFDKVIGINDASIEPSKRCLAVASLMLEGGNQFDLYVFSVNGGYYRQVTDSPDRSEMFPEWRSNGQIVFTDNGSALMYQTDSFGNRVEPLKVGEVQLAGKQFAVSPLDRYASFTTLDRNIVVWDLLAGELYDSTYLGEHSAWLPDASGMSYQWLWNLMKVEFGGNYTETIVTQAVSVVWSPESKLNGFGHLYGNNGQRSWLQPNGNAELRTGKPFVYDQKSSLSRLAQADAHWTAQEFHRPLDWEVDPKYGQQANYAAAQKWMETLAKVEPSSLRKIASVDTGTDTTTVVDNTQAVVAVNPTQGPTPTATLSNTAGNDNTVTMDLGPTPTPIPSKGFNLWNLLGGLALLFVLGLVLTHRKPNNGSAEATLPHEEADTDNRPFVSSTQVQDGLPVIASSAVHSSVGPAKRRLWPYGLLMGTFAILAFLAFRRRRNR